MEFAIHSHRVQTPEGEIQAAILIKGGRIDALLPLHELPEGVDVYDAGESVVMPGVVDTHVHINEPGRTEWEGFETATRAAAAGGITTLVDMPLNSSPVTTSPEALTAKIKAAEGQCWVDMAFWGGLVPANARALGPLLDAGVVGVKAFLCHSGIDDFPQSSKADLRAGMPALAERGKPLLVHAELEVTHPSAPASSERYADFLASRPPEWEVEAVRMMIDLCRKYRGPVHIVHLSSADALPLIAAAKAEGLPLTAETCPHYLVFAAEEIPDGATHYKCAPPIRERENRERLWQGLRDGTLDFVACDHSPCTPGLKLLKTGDFMNAWGGIASLQFSMSVVWTHARERGFTLEDLRRWLCERTARFAGLERKGAIAPGYDADLVIWSPESTFTVRPENVLHRHPITPYADRTLHGVVERTYLRGQLIYDQGNFPAGPIGHCLLTKDSIHA